MNFLKPSEYGEMKGVSKRTVIRWIESGKLEATRTAGGHYRIPYNEEFHEKLPSYTSSIQMAKLCAKHGPASIVEEKVSEHVMTVKVRAFGAEMRRKMLKVYAGGMSADEGFDIGNCNACLELKNHTVGEDTQGDDGPIPTMNQLFMKTLGDAVTNLRGDNTFTFNLGPVEFTVDKAANITINHVVSDEYPYNVVAHDDIIFEEELVEEDDTIQDAEYELDEMSITGDPDTVLKKATYAIYALLNTYKERMEPNGLINFNIGPMNAFLYKNGYLVIEQLINSGYAIVSGNIPGRDDVNVEDDIPPFAQPSGLVYFDNTNPSMRYTHGTTNTADTGNPAQRVDVTQTPIQGPSPTFTFEGLPSTAKVTLQELSTSLQMAMGPRNTGRSLIANMIGNINFNTDIDDKKIPILYAVALYKVHSLLYSNGRKDSVYTVHDDVLNIMFSKVSGSDEYIDHWDWDRNSYLEFFANYPHGEPTGMFYGMYLKIVNNEVIFHYLDIANN